MFEIKKYFVFLRSSIFLQMSDERFQRCFIALYKFKKVVGTSDMTKLLRLVLNKFSVSGKYPEFSLNGVARVL